MKSVIELHEQIDEVNYFLREWQRLAHSHEPFAVAVRKPEIKFVSHALARVIHEAQKLNIPVLLKVGDAPVVAKRNKRRIESSGLHVDNVFIPSRATVEVTDYIQQTTNGKKVSYIGSKEGVFPMSTLAQTVAHGGELTLRITDSWEDEQEISLNCSTCLV